MVSGDPAANNPPDPNPAITALQGQIAALQATVQQLQNQNPQPVAQANNPQGIFVSNPYQADINPSTSNGLKMYQNATAKRDPLLNPRIKSKKEFLDAMKSDAVSFGWGTLINKIDVAGTEYSILSDVQKLDVDKVRAHMSKYLYIRNSTQVPPDNCNMTLFDIDPDNVAADKVTFYARVRSNMIGERIWNSLNQSSQTSLQTHAKKFIWKSTTGDQLYDGPTMLQILVQSISPSTMVGLSTLKDKLRSINLASFNHNVVDMFTHQTRIYNEILQLGKSHDDIEYDTFKALLTTTNEEYEMFVNDLKSKWETNSDDDNRMTHDEIVAKCTEKCNNLVDQKDYKFSCACHTG